MTKKFDLVIFDWDGTLMDTVGKIVACMQSVATELSLVVPSEQQVRDIIGLSLPAVMDELFADYGDKHEIIIETYRQHHQASQHATPLFNGSRQLLNQLDSEGYQLAVATGKARPGLDLVLSTTGLSEHFKTTRSASEAKSKPHPQMIESILAELNVPASRAVMVGDSRHDLNMASNAKVASIGVSYGAHCDKVLSQCNPIAIIDNPLALKQFL
ncbi:HAD-IA family hydrolase [Shewanella maritima]|uniref:HAD-IA family hydrolase n=1 Tax=Shewanella maritima TaxID=2520507 RepID=UPI003735DCA1